MVNFSREEIPEQQELRDAEPVVLEDTYNNPLYYWVLQDSIVLANNQSGSEYFLEFFSLQTRQRLLGVGTHGNGPGEFLNLIAFVPDCQAETFLAIDLNRNLYFEIDWKKTLEKKLEGLHPIEFHRQLILFGRNVCTARNPRCMECPLKDLCRDWKQRKKGA